MSATPYQIWLTNLTLSTAAIRLLVRKGILEQKELRQEIEALRAGLRLEETFLTDAVDDALKAVDGMLPPDN
jgi:hypothetical protein